MPEKWGLVGEGVADDVFAHFQGLEARLLAVVVDILVLPAVAEVALPGEEAHQTSFPYEAVAFGWLVVVLVYFRQAVGEVIFLVVDGMAKGQFDKIQFGEDFLHLRHDEFAQAVVVVDVQESAADKVVA